VAGNLAVPKIAIRTELLAVLAVAVAVLLLLVVQVQPTKAAQVVMVEVALVEVVVVLVPLVAPCRVPADLKSVAQAAVVSRRQ